MGWEIFPAKVAFPKFAQEWDRLNRELYDGHPLFDSRFVGPMLEFFASGKEQLCICQDDGGISGALIMQADGMGRWSSFKPSQSQATALMVKDPHDLESLLKSLPGFVWSIELYAIDPRYAPDLSQLKLIALASPQAHTIGVYPHARFSDYWDSRSKNLRANVRRYLNRAEKESAQSVLSKIVDSTEMSTGVRRFGELETAGWKGEAGTAISMENEQGAFYCEVLRRFALSNQASVYELRVGNQLAASRLVITNDQMFVILKTTYDETLARFAPGRILLYRVIQEQLDCKTGKTIEFYTNATRDQKEWATFGCTIQNIQVFRNSLFANIFTVLKALRDHLRRSATPQKPATKVVNEAIEIRCCPSVESLVSEQLDLTPFATSSNIESSIAWFDLLQNQIYPDDSGVRYYFVAEDRRPSIILPVRLTTQGGLRIVESLANYYTSLYSPLLTDESEKFVLRQILAAVSQDHKNPHVMRFSPMDPQSPMYAGLLNELRAIGWVPFKYFCFGNWFLEVGDNWQDYLKKRSANLRSAMKRRNKAFSAAGGTLEVVTSMDGIEEAIEAFQEIYSASWKIPEPYPNFIPLLIRHLATAGMLRLGIARLGDRPVAAQLWIVSQDKASIYKVAYHKAFASYSPGTVLTGHLMQYVIERDHAKEVDFLIGDDKYKQIWMSNRRERWGIVAYNPRTPIGFVLLLKELLAQTTKSVRDRIKSLFKESESRGQPPKWRSRQAP